MTKNNFSILKSPFYLSVFLTGLLCIFFIVLLRSKTASEFETAPLLYLYAIMVTIFQLSRLAAASLFKFSLSKVVGASGKEKNEPPITFIIPCKNEEGAISRTIHKCFVAHYPKEKIQVIVINDGSTDNTPNILDSLKLIYPNLTVIHWEQNRGKRHAIAEGVKQAKGEIIIPLDSDSFIEPNDLPRLIEVFSNPAIGAVCAHTDPYNADDNFITRLQTAYYFVSFKILKAAESAFLNVFCCSGCSSAYRVSIIRPIVDKWLNEVFAGLPVTWGDDRSLTNYVLEAGYKTLYIDTVQSYTVVPNSLKKFLKQQIRWKKSWFVSSLRVSRFIWKRNPFIAFTYFFPLFFFTITAPIIAFRALLYTPLVTHTLPFYYLFGVFLVTILFLMYYRFVNRSNKYWPYVIAWSALNTFFFSSILYYSLITIQDRRWGTR